MLHTKWSQEEIEKAGIEALFRAEEEAAARAEEIARLVKDLELEEYVEGDLEIFLEDDGGELRPGLTKEAAVKIVAQGVAEELLDFEEAEMHAWYAPSYSEYLDPGSVWSDDVIERHVSAEYESAEDYDSQKAAAKQADMTTEFARLQQEDQELIEAVKQGILAVMQPSKAYYFRSPCWASVAQKVVEDRGVTDGWCCWPTWHGGPPGIVHMALNDLIRTGAIRKTDDKLCRLYLTR
jgi:hypothetical protein